MARTQIPASFEYPEETEKIDKRIEELGLNSRYAYLRYCVLKELGLKYIGSTRPKQKAKTKRNIKSRIDVGNIQVNRENREIREIDPDLDSESE